jgi:hypothetical protein
LIGIRKINIKWPTHKEIKVDEEVDVHVDEVNKVLDVDKVTTDREEGCVALG